MERFVVFITRLLLKVLKVDHRVFMNAFGSKVSMDFLPLAYAQRGILKYLGDTSGEKHLLHNVLASELPVNPTILDIGANVGDFTCEIHKVFPKANVFSFEPNPKIADDLENRVGSFASVIKSAVGDQSGSIRLYNNAKASASEHGSLYAGALTDLHGYNDIEHVDVPITTLDFFCQTRHIKHIDFLKIDTEGHEHAVLKGSLSNIKERRISAIQFEFNEMNIISRVFLKDFFTTLCDFDFYRLDTETLHPLKYSSREEIFQFQNILAVQSNTQMAANLKIRFAK